MELPPLEQRVLGALLEKAATTPETYPVTSNALVLACNQSSNRDPVFSSTEEEVLAAVGALRERGWARSIKRPGDRVMKHRHDLDTALGLDLAGLGVLAVLLLRGAQTPGELRSRTDRYGTFDIEATLDRLAAREEPLVRRLERRPGQKEARWAHVLGPVHEPSGSPMVVGPRSDRVGTLEARLEAMEARVSAVEAALGLEPPPPA